MSILKAAATQGGVVYRVTNPATGAVGPAVPTISDAQLEEAIALGTAAFSTWRRTPVRERAQLLRSAAALLLSEKHALAALATEETGKLIGESDAEVELVAEIFAYFADHGPGFLADEPVPFTPVGATVQKHPLGMILGIMPWNYPYYQVARFVAPNLMLGNTLLVKPAPTCPASAAAFEDLLHRAGVPVGVYATVLADNEQVAQIVADPRVQGVSLTGSERAGEAVAEIAGRHLKKYVLELGGSDPFIVLDTDDLDAVVNYAAVGRMENAGQACNSPKRFIVASTVYDEFVHKLKQRLDAMTPGDPNDPATPLAPMASVAAADGLLDQVADAVNHGAVLHTGGGKTEAGGAFVQPTLLTDVKPGMRAYAEELFGPVAVVYNVADDEAAIALANDSPYGLGATIFAKDPERAAAIAARLDVGMVSTNQPMPAAAALPFGGVKRSGVGRELGPLGMDEFVNRKLVLP